MRWQLVLVASMVVACAPAPAVSDAGTDSAPPPDPNCPFIDASACQQPVPSYTTDVVPILDKRCNSTCHAPGVGPWPLTNYQDVFDWADIIGGYIEQCGMPPPDAGAGDGNMTDQERALVLNWLACGAPNN